MTVIAARGWTAMRSRRLNPSLKQPLAIIGIAVAVLWVLIAIFAPLIAPYDPNFQANITIPSGPRGATCSARTSWGAMSSAA